MQEMSDRLPFTLPGFTRTSWVSDRARAEWEGRLKRISQAWQSVEIESVRCGVRDAAMILERAENVNRLTAELERHGLAAKIMPSWKVTADSACWIEAPRPNSAASVRVAIGRNDATERLALAYENGDDKSVGAALGYPQCCCDFFYDAKQAKLCDTTWPMGVASATLTQEDLLSVECAGPPEANILWRWLDVRAVPHCPCRFDCSETVSLAVEMLEVGRKIGFVREMDDLLTVLSWPVEWSALHGIAEIKTPIIKIVTGTDATARRYRVRRIGTAYPSEGAVGLVFPYQTPTPTRTPSRRIAPIELAPSVELRQAAQKRENGFASRESMDAAHAPLVNAAKFILNGLRGNILDLGCGNGALLKKILSTGTSLSPHGIDRNGVEIAAAQRKIPEFAHNFHIGNMWESTSVWNDRYCLVLLGIRRLDEVNREEAEILLARLAAHADNVLI